jgi:hypothetical protein
MKQEVTIIQVPWSVSTTVSHIQCHWSENGECAVHFDAYFGHHIGYPKYRRVDVFFERCVAAKMRLISSDEDVIVQGLNECTSALRGRPNTDSELRSWLCSYADKWASDGNCPDPNFYAVFPSLWLDEFTMNGLRHFVVKGTDGFVEILASSYRWSIDDTKVIPEEIE